MHVAVAARSPHLLELLLLGPALLGPHFALDVLHHFDVGLQVFGDSLGEDEVEHEVVSLRLQRGDCIGLWEKSRQTQVGGKLCSMLLWGRAGAPWCNMDNSRTSAAVSGMSCIRCLTLIVYICKSAPHYVITCRPHWSCSHLIGYSLGSTDTTHP